MPVEVRGQWWLPRNEVNKVSGTMLLQIMDQRTQNWSRVMSADLTHRALRMMRNCIGDENEAGWPPPPTGCHTRRHPTLRLLCMCSDLNFVLSDLEYYKSKGDSRQS